VLLLTKLIRSLFPVRRLRRDFPLAAAGVNSRMGFSLAVTSSDASSVLGSEVFASSADA
jgi:hypothetical protein